MQLRIFIIIVFSLFLTNCGSSKKTTSSSRKSKIVLNGNLNLGKSSKIKAKQISLGRVKEPIRVTPENTKEYILKFAPIAIRKMKEYKIPASITLAQGILESGSGRSPLAIRSNNHFGIKCHKGWQGKSVTHDDDEIGECFRKYKYPESSYDDHSKFLTSRKRYANLFKLKTTNYKGWAYGLKRAGYATDRRYPQKLIGLIHRYNLDKYDRMTNPNKVRAIPQRTVGNYYKVKKGDTLYSIAKRHDTSVKQLKKINGLTDNIISIGQHLLVN